MQNSVLETFLGTMKGREMTNRISPTDVLMNETPDQYSVCIVIQYT